MEELVYTPRDINFKPIVTTKNLYARFDTKFNVVEIIIDKDKTILNDILLNPLNNPLDLKESDYLLSTGIYKYKLVDNMIVKKTYEEIDAELQELIKQQKPTVTINDRVNQLEEVVEILILNTL